MKTVRSAWELPDHQPFPGFVDVLGLHESWAKGTLCTAFVTSSESNYFKME